MIASTKENILNIKSNKIVPPKHCYHITINNLTQTITISRKKSSKICPFTKCMQQTEKLVAKYECKNSKRQHLSITVMITCIAPSFISLFLHDDISKIFFSSIIFSFVSIFHCVFHSTMLYD